MSTPKNLTTYSSQEVDAILGRSTERFQEGGRVSHDELMETAREIGMTTLEVEAAIADQVKARAAEMAREEARQRAAGRLLQHVALFVVGTAVLYVVDTRFTGGRWYFFAALAWGVGLGVYAARTFTRRPPEAPADVEVHRGKLTARDGEDRKRAAG